MIKTCGDWQLYFDNKSYGMRLRWKVGAGQEIDINGDIRDAVKDLHYLLTRALEEGDK